MDREILEYLSRLERKMDRIDKKLTTLLNSFFLEKKNKSTLVKVYHIQDLTGWDKKAMAKARKNGWVKQVKNKAGIFYELESVNPVFITNSKYKQSLQQ